MKKVLIAAAIAASATAAQAADYSHLVLRLTDGTEQQLEAEGLKITFAEGNLVATTGGQTTTVALSSLSAMYFANASATAISGLADGAGQSVSLRGGQIYVTGEAGQEATIVSLSGMVMSRQTLASSQEEAVGGKLAKGVYILKVGNKTTKISVK